MRENDGRKLDHTTLEEMRMRAVAAVEAGQHPEDVAATMGMARSTVFGWIAKYRDGGKQALKARPVPGRPSTLSAGQLGKLYALITGVDPRQLQFDFALWTREMIQELIRREFDVSMSPSAVGRLLRRLGLSPQRPLWRAWQADPDAVQTWKTEDFPGIRAQAKKEGGTVYFADEAGLRSDYHAGTTWAPVGQTPIVKATGARHSLNMVSAVSAQGRLRFSTFTGSFTAERFIEFCKKLLHDTDGPVYLIVDGHPTHKAKAVKKFVASTGGQLKLFILPAYSPQLNPDEWVWKNVKCDRVGRTSVTSAEEFKAKIIGALRRLQNMPQLVRAFFGDPELRYIEVFSAGLGGWCSRVRRVARDGGCVAPGCWAEPLVGSGLPRSASSCEGLRDRLSCHARRAA